MKCSLRCLACTLPFFILAWSQCSPPPSGQAPVSRSAEALPAALPFTADLPGSPDEYDYMKMGGEGEMLLRDRPVPPPWGEEYIIQESPVPPAGVTVQCTAGRNAVPYKPWLLLRHRQTHEGIGGSIAYPGNWKIEIQPADSNQTRVRIDTTPGSLKVIKTVEGMPIPGVLISRFQGTWDEGALPISRFIRSHLLRKDLPDWPWVQFNTWYDRYQDISEQRLIQLARKAASLGCELFMVDAGWYGSQADWSKALGDWTVNQERLPNGMEPVAAEVRRLGMKFGMWIEIEHASRYSPVAKEHPDWFHTRNGERVNERGPLNFGRQEVVDWAKAQIDHLMERYRLDYIKMDFNANLGDGGDPVIETEDALWEHYRGLMELWGYMRKRYPDLVIENCSSGSLRMGPSIASMTDTHWVSDEVSDNSNLAMNFAMTYLFPPEICNHWTVFPKDSQTMNLETAFRVSLMGEAGISGSILDWDEKTSQMAGESIALYKEIRPMIREAEVHHLTDQVNMAEPRTWQVAQYQVPKTGASLIFAFRANDPNENHRIVPREIDRTKTYDLVDKGGTREVSGKELADGLDLQILTTGGSELVRISPKD